MLVMMVEARVGTGVILFECHETSTKNCLPVGWFSISLGSLNTPCVYQNFVKSTPNCTWTDKGTNLLIFHATLHR
jgi:hypothetical protein